MKERVQSFYVHWILSSSAFQVALTLCTQKPKIRLLHDASAARKPKIRLRELPIINN